MAPPDEVDRPTVHMENTVPAAVSEAPSDRMSKVSLEVTTKLALVAEVNTTHPTTNANNVCDQGTTWKPLIPQPVSRLSNAPKKEKRKEEQDSGE